LFIAEGILNQISAVNLGVDPSEQNKAARAFAVNFHKRLHILFNRNPYLHKQS
jgi:hypothetical protein